MNNCMIQIYSSLIHFHIKKILSLDIFLLDIFLSTYFILKWVEYSFYYRGFHPQLELLRLKL